MTDDEPGTAPQRPPPRRPRRWRATAAIAVAAGLVLAAAAYVVMDRRAEDLRQQEAAADERSAGLGGLLEGLLDDPDELRGLLDELLDGEMDEFDARLLECIQPADGAGLRFGTGSIPDADIEAQVATVAEIVEAERGLPADGEFDIEFVSRAEVQRRAVAANADHLDQDRAAVTSRLLSGLGAAERDLDLVAAQLDALEAGVVGFYQRESGQLVIGSESMDGLGAFVTAHELVHAMADAALGLPDLDELADQNGSDAAYAALAAIEGDASLYSQQFVLDHLPFEQLLALEAAAGDAADDLAGLPYFVRRNLEFPYVEGMVFSCDVFLSGGWDAVDETYRNPPATSAQVLFPDRYRSGAEVVQVRQPSGPDGWELLDTDTFGAADLLFLLEAPGDDPAAALSDPVERVAAWAGGQAWVWGDGGATAVALVLVDRGGAPPLCDTVTDFYGAAFPDATQATGEPAVFEGSAQTAVVSCSDSEVALGIGPDLATAQAAIG
jgi:hypothetical protein